MRTISLLLVLAAFVVAGCGDDEGDTAAQPASDDAAMEKKDDAAMEKKDDAAMEKKDDAAMEKGGATITLRDSNFGPMLFDSNKQAIYVFELDGRNKTVCYDECAEAWPPVFSKGEPQAGKGVR